MTYTIKQKYGNAKRCAKERNIEWHFTFESWLEWWGDDIINRGTRKGQLVMARYGDLGPYHPDNVRKATKHENNTEAHKGKSKPSSIGNFNNSKPIQTPFGIFPSRTAAARHIKMSPHTIGYRLKQFPTEYYDLRDV